MISDHSAAAGDMAALRSAKHLGSFAEVFLVFLRLGLTSFGGPVAHLGYFRDEFVVRRRWFDDRAFADLVALCQFLPGPASSQVGIAVGLLRAGYAGAFAAWLGFTLPSAIVMVLFAYGVAALGDVSGVGWIHGLQVAAVAVVARAVLGMMISLAPDVPRASIAVAASVLALVLPSAWSQIGAIVVGALIGLALPRPEAPVHQDALPLTVGRRAGGLFLVVFFVLLGGLPLLAAAVPVHGLAVFDAFFRTGSLVFGGGHVGCCRCCRRRSCRRAGSATTASLQAMALHRRCRARFSRSLRI